MFTMCADKKDSMRFIVVSNYYPTEDDPIFVFSQQIAHAMANCQNIETIVISPKNITRKLYYGYNIGSFSYIEKIGENETNIKVYAYPYLSFSNTKSKLLKFIQKSSYKLALRKCIRKAKVSKNDVCYAIFWSMAKSLDEELFRMSIKSNIIVESSESKLQEEAEKYTQYSFKNLKGIVCVSTETKNICEHYHLLDKAPYALIPNGFDDRIFKKKNKRDMRKLLGMPEEVFIVVFVGGFIERKGIIELSHVLNNFDDIYSIFIGRGPIEPQCRNILYKGSLQHKEIPNYLSCADLFVFPSKHEGCSNAIIEALGCGLPIISSDRDFNREILDDSCAILVNPDDEAEIFNAIYRVKNDNHLREKMELAALEKARGLTIENRTKQILDFIQSIIN